MGETLKERLDRLSENEAEANAKVRSDPSRENWDVWDRAANDYRIALSLAYRSGDLIPRDAITPAMAAEVLLGDIPNPIFDRLKYPLSGEFKVTCAIRDEDGDELDMDVTVDWPTIKDIIRAALTAIKESNDD